MRETAIDLMVEESFLRSQHRHVTCFSVVCYRDIREFFDKISHFRLMEIWLLSLKLAMLLAVFHPGHGIGVNVQKCKVMVNVRYYVAQYPVLEIAHSALHFTF